VVEAAERDRSGSHRRQEIESRAVGSILKRYRSPAGRGGVVRRSLSATPMPCVSAMSCLPSAIRSAWDRRDDGIVSALAATSSASTLRELHPDRRRNQSGQLGRSAYRHGGNLVGINTRFYSRSGDRSASVSRSGVERQASMSKSSRPAASTRGWIGVEAREITPEMGESSAGHTTGY